MLFQFGDIRFELLDGPTSFELEESTNYTQQERISGKPTLQSPGGILNTISINLTLTNQITADVAASLSNLRSMRELRKEAELVNGAGFSYGTYVIQKMRSSVVKTDAKGVVTHVDVSLDLLEYVPYEPESASKLKARKAAFASISANPIQVVPKTIISTPKAATARAITVTAVNSRASVENAKKAVSIPALAGKYLNAAVQQMQKATTAVAEAKTAANAVQSGVSNITDLKSTLDNMQSRTESFLTGLKDAQINPSALPGVVSGSGAAVEGYIRTLTSKAAVLSTVVSTRQ